MPVADRPTTLLDGGMGQELRKRTRAPATPLWSAQVMRDEPDLVAAVHRDYIAAGADVITANTYVATPQRLARDGTRLRSGEPLAEAASAVVDAGADAVLINCSAPEAVTTAMPLLADRGVPFGGYANGFEAADRLEAGGTVDALAAREGMTPAVYAGHVQAWTEAGATMVGGCCEIGPAHIAELQRRFG